MIIEQANRRALQLYLLATVAHTVGRARFQRLDERGEGVISTAIAVLIMAVIGVAAYLGWQAIFDDTASRVEDQVNQIG